MTNTLKTTFLLALLTALFVFVGYAIGGQSGMMYAFGLAMLMNFVSYWFSDKIVLRMYNARQVSENDDPKLHAMVRRLSITAGIPMPKVYVIPQDSPNAFATGRNPKNAAVAVTSGIRLLLSEDELEGVMAHELAHVKNRDILIGTIAATMAGAVMILARMARFVRGRSREGGGIVLLISLIVAPIAAILIQMAVSRSNEYRADESGGRFCGKPESLARALEKISARSQKFPMEASPATAHMFILSPLTGGGLMSLFSTHPPVGKRIERLLAMRGGAL